MTLPLLCLTEGVTLGTWALVMDEVRLPLMGDGSDRAVRMGFQAWDDDLLAPLMFEQPVAPETLQLGLPGSQACSYPAVQRDPN